MSNLTHRAERALLGALLRDPGQIENVRFVTASDFASPQHRMIFTAITASETRPGSGQLRELGEACPKPANAPAYAHMVAEASLRRRLAAHAHRLVEDAGTLNQEIGRVTSATYPGHGAEVFPAHLLKLAHSMLRHAWGFDQEPGSALEPDTQSPAPTRTGDDRQAKQEEEVLADLIHHFWQNSNVLDWLPADAFTSGPRREIYQAIVTLAGNNEPVDELTVDWQLARNWVTVQATSSKPGQTGPEPGYVAKLASLAVADGTATLTGHLLLNRHAAAQPSARPAHEMNGNRSRDHALLTMPEHSPHPSLGLRPPRPGSPPLLRPPPGQGQQPNLRGPEPRP